MSVKPWKIGCVPAAAALQIAVAGVNIVAARQSRAAIGSRELNCGNLLATATPTSALA